MTSETLMLQTPGWSHPDLPVVIHRGMLPVNADEAEDLAARNGWRPQWRNGVFGYDHFHSIAFEALGVLEGRARLRLGGPEGKAVEVEKGYLLILPPGTGHRLLEEAGGFLIFGAYP
ncbi:cupin [Rhodobacter sp. NSM]|uniref:cupin n=1 Tax=Rhodobacter sp. NSM TaxID=3457501 RepID=UPI003FD24511